MIRIYNSLSRQKEVFKPIHPGKINMYVCGITVYDFCHLGHARMLTAFDMITRYLRFRGYEVNYVRNITDIDDKIIKRAKENNETVYELTGRFIQAMNEDITAIKLIPPNHEPKATDHIPQMIAMIQTLITNGYAYIGENGDVYYEVRKFKNYGCLAHRDVDKLESGARVEVSEVKRDPLDFVLWKIAKADEPAWESPWGAGRPGWHIECSAMSTSMLGEHFDIHGGGKDLIFPHHENEIAQSEGATHKKFANFWMHNGYVQTDKEKMSKSLGNFTTIRDLLKEHHPEAIRYFIISSQYRSPLQYSDDALKQAHTSLSRLYMALRDLPLDQVELTDSDYEKKFLAAMDDDFNTPIAFSVLFDLAHEIQRLRDENINLASQYGLLLIKLAGVLGILQESPAAFLQSGVQDLDVNKIEALIAERNQARTNKDFATADRVRKELTAMSIAIEDGAQGTSWRQVK